MGVTSIVGTSSGSPVAQASAITASGGEYHPLTPTRIFDTRSPGINDVDKPGPKAVTPGSGSTFDVQVLGQGGLPSNADHVLAVAVTITVINPTAPGYLRAWGKGATEGTSSVVNFQTGGPVPNMAIVVPGADGKVSMRLVSGTTSGTANVAIDVVGWFSTSTYGQQGSRLIPVGPGRVYDSRQSQFRGQPIGAGQSVQIPIRGANSVSPQISPIVPNSNDVTGVLVNITGVNNTPASAGTFVSALPSRPASGTQPTTSNLNLRPGQVKANLALVPVGPDGSIWLYNAHGQVNLVVDVVAYMQPRPVETRVGRVIPLASPYRVLDTREAQHGAVPLGPGMGEDWNFRNFAIGDPNDPNDKGATIPPTNTPVGPQLGFLGNLTGTGLTRPDGWFTPVTTYLSVYPRPQSGNAVPTVSNLNLTENVSVPNMALFRYGSGSAAYEVRVYNYNGHVHYIADAAALILAD